MLQADPDHVAERAALGIPPLPLSAKQTGELIELLKNPPAGEVRFHNIPKMTVPNSGAMKKLMSACT